MAPEVLDYDRAAARIGRNLAVIAALGTVAGLVAGGWECGAGFLLGSMISWLNYRWLRSLVERLEDMLTQQIPSARRRGIVIALRYLALAAAAYVILRYTPINKLAVVAGIFALTAAVFIEVIFEIAYARK